MDGQPDARTLEVLSRALESSSRVLRLRAVCMLARVEADQRSSWLSRAMDDPDQAVRDAALAVSCWTVDSGSPPWPDREEPAHDRPPARTEPDAEMEESAGLSWEWEYAVEVWRQDGLLVGVFLSTACQEDDEHARRIALGQAILSNADVRGETFDPATAAAFIVGKRRVHRRARSPRRGERA